MTKIIIKLDYSNLRKMKKIFSALLLTLSIVCFIWASEIDLELFSITVMTIGSGTDIYKTLAIVFLGVIILKIRKKYFKL
jgi:hypothetical protein